MGRMDPAVDFPRMMPMRRDRRHRSPVACVAVAVVALSSVFATKQYTAQAAAAAQQQQVASVEELKSEAFKALRSGQFDRSNELLGQAAALSRDPQLERMAGWTKNFETQRQEFAAERHKQFDKAVRKVKLLVEKGKGDYALDWAASAYLLSDDKKRFRQEAWVDELVTRTIKKAEEYDAGEHWLKALRLYSDLSSIDPAVPLWKEKLKLSTRRVRLLALYAPTMLEELRKSETKDGEEVEAILKDFEKAENLEKAPTTEPTVAEKDKKAEEEAAENDEFRIDWRESLRGVTMDMLWPALVQARENYFRDVGYTDLTVGGLSGVKAVITTNGLETAFPTLKDDERKQEFLKVLEDHIQAAGAAEEETAQ